ncbi:dTDP-glucose 4,6-dehydratase [Candidatus Woesebacteria bacterium]|nr:dTDP-glucose 4,6-dehydratase [Candidatus Woesebacteria bacterium]
MKLLVTGGAGFIGSNFIRYWFKKYPKDKIVNLDKLTYAGHLSTTKDFSQKENYKFVKGDVGDFKLVSKLTKSIDVVVNFAAESHNDRAIQDPGIFVKTNVLGTQILLEAARREKVKRFHHISTCEVFGELELDEKRSFKEDDPFRPRTPYNASKAAADHVVMAYYYTFGMPITISHCCNNLGPYQHPEKLIPRFVTNLMEDKNIPLYKSSQFKREWIYVDDHNNAVDSIIEKGRIGEIYNIGTGEERSVEEIADRLLELLDKPKSLKKYVPDRKSHDKRYLLNTQKIRSELKWQPRYNFSEALDKTIKWYEKNEWWWRPLKRKAESLYDKTGQK